MISKFYQQLIIFIKSRDTDFFLFTFFYFLNSCFIYAHNFGLNYFLPVEEMGTYSNLNSICNLLVSICSLEIYCVYLRFLDSGCNKNLRSQVNTVLLCAFFIYATVIFVAFKSFLLLPFFCFSLYRERLYYYRAKLQIVKYGVIQLVFYVISILMIITLFSLHILKGYNFIFSQGIIYGILYLLCICFFRKVKENNRLDDHCKSKETPLRDLLKYSVPGAVSGLFGWAIGAADQAFINAHLSVEIQAGFAVAFRTIGVIRILAGSFFEFWPRYYVQQIEKKALISLTKARSLFVLLYILSSLLMIYFAKFLYLLMGAGKYSGTVWIFQVLMVSEIFRVLGSLNVTYFSYILRGYLITIAFGVLGSLKLGANFFYNENLGVEFFVYSTVFIYVLFFLFSISALFAERKHCRVI